MEKNNNTFTFYVTWETSNNTAQVVRVNAHTELGAVAIAAPRCKCYDRESVRVFSEENLKQILGKKKSCRCYSGEDILVYVEEYKDKVNIGSTQFYKCEEDGLSKLLITLLVYSYDHESNMIIGSTKDFPYISVGAAPYEVDYAEPYIK